MNFEMEVASSNGNLSYGLFNTKSPPVFFWEYIDYINLVVGKTEVTIESHDELDVFLNTVEGMTNV